MKEFFWTIAALSLLISCNGNQSKESKSDAVSIETKKEEKDFKEESKALLFRGMIEDARNELGGLQIGEIAPDFIGRSSNKSDFQLRSLLMEGPVVLVFYRGTWCPICIKHLALLEENIELLKEKNVQLIAISPENAQAQMDAAKKSSASYNFISDPSFEIMEKYNVKYKASDKLSEMLANDSTKNEDIFLPVPATFVIGQDGKVRYSHYEHDYTKRSSLDEILNAL